MKKKLFIVGILKVTDEKSRIQSRIRIPGTGVGSASGSVSKGTDPRIRISIHIPTKMSRIRNTDSLPFFCYECSMALFIYINYGKVRRTVLCNGKVCGFASVPYLCCCGTGLVPDTTCTCLMYESYKKIHAKNIYCI